LNSSSSDATTPTRPAAAWPSVKTREIVAWAMFDFANSSYTTIIVTVAFSVFFRQVVAGGPHADTLWGTAVSLANTVVLLLSPLMGAVADESGRKKGFLFASYLLCVVGTAALAAVGPGDIGLGIALFVVSMVAFSFGENFTAAFLPELSTPANVGRISGFGWGLGYFGGLASLMLVRPWIGKGFTVENLPNLQKAWIATAVFFLVAGLPTFLILRERAPRGHHSLVHYAASSLGRLKTTLREVRRFRELAKFLVVFFLFSCGLTAIIAFVGVFAEHTLRFAANELIGLFLVVQLSSAGGAFAFGFLQDRLGARRTLQLTLLIWILVCIGVYATESKSFFWGLALFAGLGIGSLQSASRGLIGMFSPVEKSGEFFGFWGLAGKAAYAVGPFVFGVVSSTTGSQRNAVLFLLTFFTLGLLGLFFVDEKKGVAAAAAWRQPQDS
jgi:UMF1 family MFS transporter